MNTNILKTINYIKRNGISDTYWAIMERLREKRTLNYSYPEPNETELLSQRKETRDSLLKISILVPSYETPGKYLKELLDSVLSQSYENWELVIADASKSEQVFELTREVTDDRIVYVKLPKNGGISANSNEGLKHCTGDYTALLDHDDLLSKDALYHMAKAVSLDPDSKVMMVYSNEDKTDGDNNIYFDPNIKPDFNLDLLLSNNYICHFLMIKTEIMKKLGFREELDGAQDHDLILRTATELEERFGAGYETGIAHVDRVLYHWRCHMDSTAANPKSKEYAYTAGEKAIKDYLSVHNINARVIPQKHLGFYYIDYDDSIFDQRKAVGAVGGRVVNSFGKVKSGAMASDKSVMFYGLNRRDSDGHLHRADCQMQVWYLDLRCMRMSPEVEKMYLDFLKKEGTPKLKEDYAKLSIRFCDIIKANGYILIYDPKMISREKDVKNYGSYTKL